MIVVETTTEIKFVKTLVVCLTLRKYLINGSLCYYDYRKPVSETGQAEKEIKYQLLGLSASNRVISIAEAHSRVHKPETKQLPISALLQILLLGGLLGRRKFTTEMEGVEYSRHDKVLGHVHIVCFRTTAVWSEAGFWGRLLGPKSKDLGTTFLIM